MRLRVMLPYRVLLDEVDIDKVIAEGLHGVFALLPRRVDFVSPIVPGILLYARDGEERVVGVDEGVLVKRGDEVRISVRDAVPGDDMESIRVVVTQRFTRSTSGKSGRGPHWRVSRHPCIGASWNRRHSMPADAPRDREGRRRAELAEAVGRKAGRRARARREGHRALLFGLGTFGLVGWSVMVPTMLGIALGVWLDGHVGGRISWALSGLVLGLTAGCLNAWYWLNRSSREEPSGNRGRARVRTP